jgi:hypothetical protein
MGSAHVTDYRSRVEEPSTQETESVIPGLLCILMAHRAALKTKYFKEFA